MPRYAIAATVLVAIAVVAVALFTGSEPERAAPTTSELNDETTTTSTEAPHEPVDVEPTDLVVTENDARTVIKPFSACWDDGFASGCITEPTLGQPRFEAPDATPTGGIVDLRFGTLWEQVTIEVAPEHARCLPYRFTRNLVNSARVWIPTGAHDLTVLGDDPRGEAHWELRVSHTGEGEDCTVPPSRLAIGSDPPFVGVEPSSICWNAEPCEDSTPEIATVAKASARLGLQFGLIPDSSFLLDWDQVVIDVTPPDGTDCAPFQRMHTGVELGDLGPVGLYTLSITATDSRGAITWKVLIDNHVDSGCQSG